jgi:hypothetical protein
MAEDRTPRSSLPQASSKASTASRAGEEDRPLETVDDADAAKRERRKWRKQATAETLVGSWEVEHAADGSTRKRFKLLLERITIGFTPSRERPPVDSEPDFKERVLAALTVICGLATAASIAGHYLGIGKPLAGAILTAVASFMTFMHWLWKR